MHSFRDLTKEPDINKLYSSEKRQMWGAQKNNPSKDNFLNLPLPPEFVPGKNYGDVENV